MSENNQAPAQWLFASRVDDIPRGKKRCVEVQGQEIILCRIYDEVFAVRNLCPHLGKTMDRGRLQGYELSCPHHNACFDIRDGQPVTGPSVWPVTVYPCKVEGDEVFVNLSTESDGEQVLKDPRMPSC